MWPNANEVYPRIYVGNYKSSQDVLWLRETGITVIVNCTKDLRICPSLNETHVQRVYRIPVDDNLEEEEIANLAEWSAEAVYIITEAWKRGNVILIHCAAGMQRSAATAAMVIYVLREYDTPQQAISHVRAGRPIAFLPATNFKKAITAFCLYYDKQIRPYVRRQTVS